MPPPSTPLPAFAPAGSASLPVHVVAADGLPDWLAGPGQAWAGWLNATQFKAASGDVRLLPAADGLAGAIIGSGTASMRARGRFGMGKAIAGLPPGDWHLSGSLTKTDATEAVLGWLLAGYRFDRYRPGRVPADQTRLKLPDGLDGSFLMAMAAGEYLTRDLINTPANDMGPEDLQAAFFALAQEHGATASAIVGDDLLAQNFPMIHAVGRASPRAPRLLEMRWGSTGPQLTLVGKGVCFDTGGLDLKPSAGMLLMKKDMGGAATVMGLALMIMRLGLPLRLRLLVPAVENSVSGAAMRPRDILTSRKGLTVEVNNTDAEGRLILADALTYASEEDGATILSMATLTGAARVAVGPDLAPYFTDDPAMADAIMAGGTKGFDPVWRLPFWDAYEPMIEPGIADLDNAPTGGFAGAITAALFLRRFVATPRYAHFDIYGHIPADLPGRPKGGAGQGARALLHALPDMLGL
ncbi:leucyl aminopeptidase family protein [Pseudotabrizicola formosa]|uniref:leucyl aminopeptidase family protein n=1 Tax=Pseudotabrizicola formosa TaxID=2030009 RepID=UPI000CD27EE6|nr:leucyl aminopeptidase family protein [Pseudotabrizicola formosa]